MREYRPDLALASCLDLAHIRQRKARYMSIPTRSSFPYNKCQRHTEVNYTGWLYNYVPVVDGDGFPSKGRSEGRGLCLVVSLEHGLRQECLLLGHQTLGRLQNRQTDTHSLFLESLTFSYLYTTFLSLTLSSTSITYSGTSEQGTLWGQLFGLL